MEIENENLEEQTGTETEGTEESAAAGTETGGEENSESSAPGAEGGEESATEEEGEEGAAAAGEEGEEGEEKPAVHKPNTKVKVGQYDPATRQFTQKEIDIDPKFHALMKTPEDEKLVRELHEKAHGLDSVKARFQEERQVSQHYNNHYSSLKRIYKEATKEGDELNILKMDKWLKAIDVPQDVMLRWALTKVNLHKLQQEDPGQYATLQKTLTAQEQADQYQENVLNNQQQNQETIRENKELQLELALKDTELSQYAAKYESLTGKPGSFREAIVNAGAQAWFTSKKDLSAVEAAQSVIQQFGLKLDAAPAPQGGAPAQKPLPGADGKPGQQIVKKKAAGTIPNLQGGSSSPLPSKPKNLDDVKKYRKEVHGF